MRAWLARLFPWCRVAPTPRVTEWIVRAAELNARINLQEGDGPTSVSGVLKVWGYDI